MLRASTWMCIGLLLIGCAAPMAAQQSLGANPSSPAVVPPLVRFSGVLADDQSKPLTGAVGVTFALYKDGQGGAPLWLETQNVSPDKTGHYSVMLGSTTSTGLPADIFVAGEARWLGVQPQGQAEHARVMLLSVPYALKAVDAQTVGGLPPSAFVLAAPPISSASPTTPTTGAQPLATGTTPVTTAGGTVNKLAKFDATADVTSSQVFDNGTNVGIGNTAPGAKLDVSGGATVRGLLNLPATGTATATAGKNSQPIAWMASAFNSGTATAVNQIFRWQAEPAGNNTATTSGTLNLLYATGTATPAETGLKIASNGRITFAAGQTFPGTNNGTVTSVGTGLGLTGGPITSSGTLAINTAVVPQLNTANTFTGNQTVNGNLSATGVVTGSAFSIGSNLFAFGSYSSVNAFLGFAGNTTTTGSYNTATGYSALAGNTSGVGNSGSGSYALATNTTGYYNTAGGYYSLYGNTTGYNNTATGAYTLSGNTTGFYNTATGLGALYTNSTGAQNTASGYYSLLANTTGSSNTADGYTALRANTTGIDNTATGAGALYASSTASYNTADGFQALYANTTGSDNTATGFTALGSNTTGSYNTALGYKAMSSVTSANYNTAVGSNTLVSNLTGTFNTAVGYYAGQSTTGNWNTNIGYYAGYLDTTGGDNIRINNYGVAGETNTARIGGSFISRTFIAGIRGVTTGVANAIPVVIDSAGQLGTVSSSRTLKQDIRDMGDTTETLMRLHPVRFRYKVHGAKGPEQFGLVAEEVAEVAPDLVARNKDGEIETVFYDKVNAMLLNEVQKQHRLIETQKKQLQSQIDHLQLQIHAQQARIDEQQAALKVQGKYSQRQQAEIARLSSQIMAIQAALKTNSGADPQVRTVKAKGTAVRQ